MVDLNQRTHRAVESILDNEALTAELNDAAARVLLDWGVACARRVVQDTAVLDDAQAEEPVALRLKAVRKLMRVVTGWFSQRGQNTALLDGVLEQAALVYGPAFASPAADKRQAFLAQLAGIGPLPEKIACLQSFIESAASQEKQDQANEQSARSQSIAEASADQEKQKACQRNRNQPTPL